MDASQLPTTPGRSSPRRYEFGAYALDPTTRELRRDGSPVRIQPRPFDLLIYLIRHQHRVVTRKELLEEVWSGVSVTAEALTYALHAARRAVGDDGIRQRVIQTIPRCGLRFVARVRAEHGAAITECAQSREGKHGGALSGSAPREFIGRRDALESIESNLASLGSASGRTLVVNGEAGIGKSRLIEEVCQRICRRGIALACGRCAEAEGAPAFWPWIQVVRSLVRAGLPEALLDHLGKGAQEIARMVPELFDRLPSVETAAPLDPRAARFLLFDSINRFFQEAAAIQPIVVILEDFHRADHASLLLFQFLAKEASRYPLMILASFREAELRMDTQRYDVASNVLHDPETRVVALKGFTLEEVEEFVTAFTGSAASPETVQELREKTAGNPLFLTQVLQLMLAKPEHGSMAARGCVDLAVPRRIQDLIAQQLSSLPDGCMKLLEIASVFGRDFDLPVLEALAGLDSSRLLDLLEIARDAGFVSIDPDVRGQYRFSHVLVRDALYHRLSTSERLRYHEQIGEHLEKRWASTDGTYSSLIAHHFYSALPLGDPIRAFNQCVAAGKWSCAQTAYEQAVASFKRALEVLDAQIEDDPERRCEIHLLLGDAETKAGYRDNARQSLLAAAHLAKRVGLPEKLAGAALRFAPDFLAIETGIYDSDLVELLEEALETIDTTDSAIRARLLVRLAVALHWADDSEVRCRSLCAEATAMAARVGDAYTETYVRSGQKLALYCMTQPTQYLDADPGGPLAPGDEPIALVLQLLRMTSLLILGRIKDFDDAVDLFAKTAEVLKQPQALWYVDLLRASRFQMLGCYKKASQLRKRYLDNGKGISDQNAVHSYLLQGVMECIDRGGLDECSARIRSIADAFPSVLGWRAGLAMVLTELKRVDEARAEVNFLRENDITGLPRRNEWFAALGGICLSSWVIEDRKFLENIYRILVKESGNFAVVGYCSYFWGPVDYLLALLAWRLGRTADSIKYFDCATRSSALISAKPCSARIAFDYGTMLIREKIDPIRGEKLLLECYRLCERLGMTRLLGKVRGHREKLKSPENRR
jgi:DNA-binding winged helix-turn-helix (wHTH) protein/tetratricopeptide (TPR) repeat protein